MPVGEKQTLRFDPFQLDTRCGHLRKNGIGLKLQGQPVQILEILLEKPGELVTREELRQRLWSTDTFVDFDHSLNAAIQRLRQALGDDAESPQYIETIPKRGYRFIGEVMRDQAANHGAPASIAPETVDTIATTLAGAELSASRKSGTLRLWRTAAVLVLMLFALATVVYWVTKPPPTPRIVRSYALTKTGFRKFPEFQSHVLTDGVVVYFREVRPSYTGTMRVPAAGGEVTELPVLLSGSLSDISPDGSEALFVVPNASGSEAWAQPLPSGAPRLIVKDARFPTWTADGRSILFVRRGDQELWQVSVDGSGARRLAEFPDLSGIAVSPDGGRIRLVDWSSRTLWETGQDGTNAKAVLTDAVFGRWSLDGKYFFFSRLDATRQTNLWVRSEERHWWKRNALTQQLTYGPLSIGMPAVSKDGRHVYAVGREPHGELSVYDRQAGAFVPYLGGTAACSLDFSRDGQWVAYVSYPEGTLWRSRIDGSERRQLTVPPMTVVNPRWSPDGKLIAFWDAAGIRGLYATATRSGQTSQIYAVSAEGGGAMLLPTNGKNTTDPTWSPDGKSIAYSADGGLSGRFHEVLILDLTTQKSGKVPGSDGLWSPRWSPDGKYLAALGGDPSKLWLFSFATQKWTELVSGNPNWPNWSHDSKSIYVLLATDNSIVRVGISDHKVERLASLQGFPSTAIPFSSWVGVTPDERPIMTRDTGIEEVYAFDLEYQ